MRFSSVLLYGMGSILFLNCAAKKPIPQVTPEQTQNIQQFEEELKDINSELSSEDKVAKILLVAELHHRSGNLQSARNYGVQFALDYPTSSEKSVALLGLALIDALRPISQYRSFQSRKIRKHSKPKNPHPLPTYQDTSF